MKQTPGRPSRTARPWTEIARPGREFIKMQGLGNHFVIIDGRETPYQPDSKEITRICNARTGVGGEELIVIEPPGTSARMAGAEARLRIFNPDGREVEACGNATRCIAHLLLEESARDRIRLETPIGVLACSRAGPMQIQAEMGKISMDWRDIPLSRECDTRRIDIESGPLKAPVALNIGNPHAVFFVDDLDAIDVAAWAPAIQNHPLFPEQVNVGVAQQIDPRHLRLSVYERPGILTAACGSGACVAVYAARIRGLTNERNMVVAIEEGEMNIEIRDDDTASMAGPVAYCFGGYLLEPPL